MYAIKNKRQAEMTADPLKYPQKRFKDKSCRRCGVTFSPKAPSHLFCSQECADDALVNNYLSRNYGITIDIYREMLNNQDHKCAICGGEGFTMATHHKTKLVVDHCHSTGVVRGLLCHNCNRALGLLQDSRLVLENAIKYLEGATTILKEYTSSDVEARGPSDG